MFNFFKNQDINQGLEEYRTTKGSVLLDVRSSSEYREGHIPGSINIDLGEIGKADQAILDKDTPLFVYCLSGGRSSMASNALKKMGYTQVTNIGGINTYTGSLEKGV